MSKNKNPEKIEAVEKAQDDVLEKAKIEQAKKVDEAIKAKSKVKEYIVKDGNGFKKRNYSIGGKQVTLIVGEKVTEEVVRMFHEKYQEKYFELV